ncbi:hypothetical protein D3C76_1501420 [compost metagenome]
MLLLQVAYPAQGRGQRQAYFLGQVAPAQAAIFSQCAEDFKVDPVEFGHGGMTLRFLILLVQTYQYCAAALVTLEQKTSERSIY